MLEGLNQHNLIFLSSLFDPLPSDSLFEIFQRKQLTQFCMHCQTCQPHKKTSKSEELEKEAE